MKLMNTLPSVVVRTSFEIIESLSNEDGNVNENVTKQ